MRLEDSYQGVTLNIQFDHTTNTYIGYLEGLSVSASVQASTYADLVDAFREAVDAHLGDRFFMARLRAEYEQVPIPQTTATQGIPEATLTSESSTEGDPWSHRQFLR